jgi:hypothetical protein
MGGKIVLLTLSCLIFTGCFPNKVAHLVEGDMLQNLRTENRSWSGEGEKVFTRRTKVFTSQGDIYLFPNGFNVTDDRISGKGEHYAFGADLGLTGRWDILRDSIVAMTYYEEKHTFGEVMGSAVFSTYTPLISFLSLYCLVCPKCCFGSCPTVYVGDDTTGGIQAECFSYCVSPFVQRPDLDLLARDVDPVRPFQFRMTNEALESHLINRLDLLAVAHPADSRVFPTDDGRVLAVRGLEEVRHARAGNGADISAQLKEIDDDGYRSGLRRFADLTDRKQRDVITFEIPTDPAQDSVTVVLRARNTLLTTALFYDVVLGSRGLNALTWTARMAEDEQYARLFYALYDEYAGVSIEVERGATFEKVGRIGDIGPIAWKDLAIRVPVTGKRTRVRLSFFPDNICIDYLAYARETLRGNAFSVTRVAPSAMRDHHDVSRPELIAKVARQDDDYLHSTPGDSFLFTCDLPRAPGMRTSVLLQSQGYYYEWLRGNWVRNENTLPPLDIFDIPGILHDLRERWLTDYRMMEEEFFRNRVPLKEKRS